MHAVATGKDLVAACDVVVLAVKPYIVATVLGDLGPSIRPNHLVIPIAAGISTSEIERELPARTAVVRGDAERRRVLWARRQRRVVAVTMPRRITLRWRWRSSAPSASPCRSTRRKWTR